MITNAEHSASLIQWIFRLRQFFKEFEAFLNVRFQLPGIREVEAVHSGLQDLSIRIPLNAV
jgi:hypothetical protein